MGSLRVDDILGGGWIAAFFIAVLAVLAWVNSISPKKWRLLSQTFFRLRLGRQTMREDINMQDRSLLGLLLVATLVTGLFGWQAGVVHGLFSMDEAAGGSLRFAEICIIALIVLSLHLMVIKTASMLFQADGGAGEYFYTIVLMFIALGLFLIPVTLLAAYQVRWRQVMVAIGGVAVLVMLLYRWVRAMAIGLGQGTPAGYIVLYLCAAEFLPAAIAVQSLQHVLNVDAEPHP